MIIRNPILTGFNPDPSIVRVGEDYYIATSTFEWFPGVQIHHSRDLVNWRLLTRPLRRASQLNMLGNPDSCGIWAPCLTYADGLFWLIYTDVKRYGRTTVGGASGASLRDFHNYLVTSPRIDGDWSDPVYLNSSGFDPSLFHDDDGRRYLLNMLWDHRPGNNRFAGIVLQEYSVMEGKLVGERQNIFKGTALGLTEAPHLYKRKGWYYLLTAEGGTGWGHAVTMARAQKLTGPYELHPDTYILSARHRPDVELQRAGHADLVDTPDGETYMVYLCGRPLRNRGRCTLGRETAIQKMVWGADDWLRTLDGQGIPTIETPAPSLEGSPGGRPSSGAASSERAGALRCSDTSHQADIAAPETGALRYDFNEPQLPIDFQWLRTPWPEEIFSLAARPGFLRLFGRETIGSLFRQSLVARRQQSHCFSAATVLEFEPQHFQHMAGLVCYYNSAKFHYLYLSHDEGVGKHLRVMSCLPDSAQADAFTTAIAIPAGKPVHLRVEVDYERLHFGYRVEGVDNNWHWLPQQFDASILADEATAPGLPNFTGAFVGMACQDLAGTSKTADFDFFKYCDRAFKPNHFCPQNSHDAMRNIQLSAMLACIALAVASLELSCLAQAVPMPNSSITSGWTADNGNGTYSNPLFYEEFEDPDVIRVSQDYYLAGTTMHMNPALIVLHSKDLVNWELASYCMERLDFGPAFRLDGGNIYGRGIWAPCVRYHDGTFYIFSNVNGVGCEVFRSRSANGPWKRNQLPGMHDVSVLFDDDGKVYAIYGASRPTIVELNKELTEIIPNSSRQMTGQGMGEGHHLYKIKGKYFDVSAIPGAHTDQVVARADSIDGPWQVERMVRSESLGVPSQNGVRGGRGTNLVFTITHSDPNSGGGLTLHQGGIVDTPSGEWWSIIMQDHGSVGRLVALVPITWDNNFPLIGLPGNFRKAPNTWIKPDTGYLQDPKPLFVRNDSFDSSKLNPVWQWNHVPDDSKWSLTEKPGVLRLHSLPADSFWTARNSLTQRPLGPESIATIELDFSGLEHGDTAGLALLSAPYAWIGVAKSAEGVGVRMFDPTTRKMTSAAVSATHVWLRVSCNFDTEEAVFSWSPDGKDFSRLGEPFITGFQLMTFQGVRLSLFNYNAGGITGGYADFDNFTMDEPRARGIERTIPVGKTITLASSADDSLLAVDAQSMLLVNMPAASTNSPGTSAQFKVVDLGKGRVALKTANGQFISIAGEAVSLKDLAGKGPADAESLQWVNLLRGDTMLMSLVNHRYLATKPNTPGQVTISSTGPRPDRKDGACFKWNQVK